MGDEHSIEIFRRQQEQHLQLYLRTSGKHYEKVKSSSKIIYDPSDLTQENNHYSIDYIPSGKTEADLWKAKKI